MIPLIVALGGLALATLGFIASPTEPLGFIGCTLLFGGLAVSLRGAPASTEPTPRALPLDQPLYWHTVYAWGAMASGLALVVTFFAGAGRFMASLRGDTAAPVGSDPSLFWLSVIAFATFTALYARSRQ